MPKIGKANNDATKAATILFIVSFIILGLIEFHLFIWWFRCILDELGGSFGSIIIGFAYLRHIFQKTAVSWERINFLAKNFKCFAIIQDFIDSLGICESQ